VSYPPDDDEPVVHGPVLGPVCGPPLPIIGPSLPDTAQHTRSPPSNEHQQSEVSVLKNRDVSSHMIELETDKTPRDTNAASASSASVVSSTSEPSTLCDVPRPSGITHKDGKYKDCAVKQAADESDRSTVSDSEVGEISTLKALHEKFVRRAVKSKELGGTNMAKHSNGCKSPDDREKTISCITDDEKVPEATSGMDSIETPASKTSLVSGVEEDDEDDYVQHMLEEPVFVRYEFVNKKYDGTEDHPSEKVDSEYLSKKHSCIEPDLEEIDQELERALVQKSVSYHLLCSVQNSLLLTIFPLIA
jgi:hypothetical protein